MKRKKPEETKQNKEGIGTWIIQGFFRKSGFILIALLAILVFFGGIRLGKLLYGSSITEKKTQITDTLLYQQLEQISELSTMKYFYTNMGKYENNIQVGNTNIPFTKKSFIISYDGIIKAGINMSQVEVQVNGKEILISIPKAEILSHEIDENSVQVYDEKNSIFNGLSVDDVTNFQKEQKIEMEQKAVSNGILEEAEENAKKNLQALYETFLKSEEYEEGYILKFEEQ